MVPTSVPSSKMTYADVVQDAAPNQRDGQWSVANRAKRGKPPQSASRPPAPSTDASASGAAAAIGRKSTSQSSKPSIVIGSKKSGPIKAVATCKRYSLFMSRLPPGTGEDSVSSYIREQTRAESVTVTKLATRFDSYESYRLDILNPPAGLDLLDPQLWAEGLIVRRFFQKRRTVSSGAGGAPGGS